jgi:hypothetical protein
MDFPKDGGLSCVRYYLSERSDDAEAVVRRELRAPGRVVGRFVCQCGAEDHWWVADGGDSAWLTCDCNGSTIPIYLGAPPARRERPGAGRAGIVIVGIGYPGAIPPLGTIDVERALEVVVAVARPGCDVVEVVWEVHLDEPPRIRGDEPWIRRIQGL